MQLRGMRVTVMGLGRFGGGVGVVRFLAARGAVVTVTDLLPEAELKESLAEIAECPVAAYHLGGHLEDDFREADLVVVNPAVPPSSPYLAMARDSYVPLTSEIALFFRFHPGRTIGVTGSNGKSTTTAMIHAILEAGGIANRLGGNIGRSLLPDVDEVAETDWAVLELSSFQLDDLDRLPASPNIAVVTNFAPNHLDWHGCLAEYRRAKQSILRWQSPDGVAILNQDDDDVRSWPTFGESLWFGSEDSGREGVFASPRGHVVRIDGREEVLPLCEWLRIPGAHNVHNAMAATCAAVRAGADFDAVRRGLQVYEPLPHRLEHVGDVDGRRFYNDSLATTPESAIVGLGAFDQPIVLLAGGYDKQIDLAAFADAIAGRAKAVALMGQTADLLSCLLDSHPRGDRLAMKECGSLDEAFDWAWEQSDPGDVVLLSPGCASYDWFRNYADRGRKFVELVRAAQNRAAG